MTNLIIFDGSNFYHRAKNLAPEVHLTKFNYRRLIEQLTHSTNNVIEYCVGEIKAEPNSSYSQKLYAQQQALFHYLKQQQIIIKKGFMLRQGSGWQEKGVDVRIAVDIIRGALRLEYNQCFIISSDSDILPAIIDAQRAGRTIIYVAFENLTISQALASNCAKTIFISKAMLVNCQNNSI